MLLCHNYHFLLFSRLLMCDGNFLANAPNIFCKFQLGFPKESGIQILGTNSYFLWVQQFGVYLFKILSLDE